MNHHHRWRWHRSCTPFGRCNQELRSSRRHRLRRYRPCRFLRRRRWRLQRCRRSRNLQQGFRYIRNRRWRLGHCKLPQASTAFRCSRIDVVTNAVAVCICSAGSSADANGVFLVTVTVAITGRDFCATAFENGARSVANSAGVRGFPRSRPHRRRCYRCLHQQCTSPPQTPRASSWFPLQSQSPVGMSLHPHS